MRWRLVLRRVFMAAVIGAAFGSAGSVASEYARANPGDGVMPTPQHAIANTDVAPWGANFFLDREVETWKREKTVQMAQAAGVRWAKQQFSWEEIEPAKGVFQYPTTGDSTWKKYDDIVALFQRYGMQVIARLDRPPAWTRKDNTLAERPPDNLADYGDFVYDFVTHFLGRIHYIQIWNEPNIYPEWGNRPVDPAGYVDLLRIAYTRAKEADPNIVVLSAPLAITTGEKHPDPGKWRSMSDIQFLEEMYKAGAKDYFDILSANAFGMASAPEEEPAPDRLNFRRVELQRRVMEKYGDDRKAVWFNEYGWNAAPASMSPNALVWQRVDESTQAQYTLRGLEWAKQNWPWAGVFCVWYFRQVGQYLPGDAAYYFRMVDVDFVPRSVYYAIKDSSTAAEPPGPGTYEETNAAVTAGEGWTQILAPLVGGGMYMESATPGSSVEFRFRGSALDIGTHCSPAGGRLLATLDGRAIPGLPRDTDGRSYVDLYAGVDWWGNVPVVRGASQADHVLALTVSDVASPTSTGRRCAIDTFTVLVGSGVGFPTTMVVGLAALGAVLTVALALDVRGSLRGKNDQGPAGFAA